MCVRSEVQRDENGDGEVVVLAVLKQNGNDDDRYDAVAVLCDEES